MFGKAKPLLFIVLLFSFSGFALARGFKDSDFDGLTDDAETQTYRTDPANPDTDRDGISDGVEVVNRTDPLDSSSSPLSGTSAKNLNLFNTNNSTPWYLARISGICAFMLLTAVVALGLVQTSKSLLRFRFMLPLTAMETHRTIAWAGLLCVVLHFSILFFDTTIRLKPLEALLPFQVERAFKSAMGFDFKIPVSLGVVALYLMLMLIVTSELRHKIVSVKAWRIIHYSSFVAYISFLIHGFTAGSDSETWWMRGIYILSLVIVFGLLLGRIFRKRLFYPKPQVVDKPVGL
jgi:predicted ferric reductase